MCAHESRVQYSKLYLQDSAGQCSRCGIVQGSVSRHGTMLDNAVGMGQWWTVVVNIGQCWTVQQAWDSGGQW